MSKTGPAQGVSGHLWLEMGPVQGMSGLKMYETDTLSRVCQDCYCNKLVISRNTETLVVILTYLTGYDESRYTVRIIHTQARTHTQKDQLCMPAYMLLLELCILELCIPWIKHTEYRTKLCFVIN